MREDYKEPPPMDELTAAKVEILRLRRLRDKLIECNELARSMGCDHTLDALRSLEAMKRGPRPFPPVCRRNDG